MDDKSLNSIPEGWLIDEFSGIPYDPSEEFNWDKAVIDLFEPDYKEPNYSITANGITYNHILYTENFYYKNPQHELTARKVMTEIFPQTKSLYKRIMPPDKFYNFGNATRCKIIKAFQAHSYLPPVTEETKPFREFFEKVSYNVKEHGEVRSNYNAARFATGYKDDDSAASLLLHYGWTPRMTPHMRGSSMHKLMIVEDGIYIDISYTHTFGERLEAACSKARLAYDDTCRRKLKIDTDYIFSQAIREFYFFKDKFISISNEYSQKVKSEIKNFIDEIISTMNGEIPTYPTIEEPDDILEDDEFLLKWDDFKFDPNAAMLEQRRDNVERQVLEMLRSKIRHLPNSVEFRGSDLPLNEKNLKSGLKYGFLIKPKNKQGKEKHGYYIINLPDEDEE